MKREEVARAIIDLDDIDKVKNYRWYKNSHGYVYCGSLRIKLHQIIIGRKKGKIIDHINGNKLDNRKKNLRHTSYSKNNRNSKSKCYYFHKRARKYCAEVWVNYKKKYLGLFKTEDEAKEVVKKFKKKYF
jgi:hypothetical protein